MLPVRWCHSPLGAAAAPCRDEPERSPPYSGYSEEGWGSTQTNIDTNSLDKQTDTPMHNKELTTCYEEQRCVLLKKIALVYSYQLPMTVATTSKQVNGLFWKSLTNGKATSGRYSTSAKMAAQWAKADKTLKRWERYIFTENVTTYLHLSMWLCVRVPLQTSL